MLNPEIKADINFKGLEELVKAMSKNYQVKVGILGSNGSKEVDKDLDMAGLGAVHEFGATIPVTKKLRAFFRYKFGINLKKTTKQIKIPARSFLRMPLERSNELLKKIRSGEDIGLIEEFFKEYGDTDILKDLAHAVGAGAVEQITDAFQSGGFGTWAPDSSITIEQKGSANPLQDKGRLMGSITYDVIEGG